MPSSGPCRRPPVLARTCSENGVTTSCVGHPGDHAHAARCDRQQAQHVRHGVGGEHVVAARPVQTRKRRDPRGPARYRRRPCSPVRPRRLPPLVPGRARQGRARRQRAGARHDGDPPYGYAIWERMQAEMDAPDQGGRRRERLLPAVHPRALPRAGGRARRGVQPRARGRDPRRRQGARGAGRRAAHQRDRDRRVHGEVGPELPRPAAAAQPVGQRRAVGAAAAAVPAHHRVPLAGGPHRARHARPTPPPTPAASSSTSTATSWSTVLALPVLVGRKTARERFAGADQHHDAARP